MAVQHLHPKLSKLQAQWLVDASIPQHDRTTTPIWENSDDPADILTAAELHGVLPSVLKHLKTSGLNEGRYSSFKEVQARRAEQLGWEMALSAQGLRAYDALKKSGLDAIIIKGGTHARRLYRTPADRTFTDVDILVPASQRLAANEIMERTGFKPFSHDYRLDKDYSEDVWMSPHSEDMNVEIHTNLAHNPKLRAAVSVSYETVLEAGNGDAENATALLFVSATHTALSHQYDRLQHLVDIYQSVSGYAGSIDVPQLKETALKSGAYSIIVSALLITGRVFNDEKCFQTVKQMQAGFLQSAPARLITQRTITDARSEKRSSLSWRRKLYRASIAQARTLKA